MIPPTIACCSIEIYITVKAINVVTSKKQRSTTECRIVLNTIIAPLASNSVNYYLMINALKKSTFKVLNYLTTNILEAPAHFD